MTKFTTTATVTSAFRDAWITDLTDTTVTVDRGDCGGGCSGGIGM